MGLLVCFVSFRVPFTGGQTYKGFLGAIGKNMGIDLKGGALAVFDAEGSPTPAQLDATVTRLESMLFNRGHFDTTVSRQGTRQIRIEMPGAEDTDAIFEAIGSPAELFMKTTNQTDEQKIRFTNDDIKNVTATASQNSFTEWEVALEFRSNKFYELAQLAEGASIQMYAGTQLISTATVNDVTAGWRDAVRISGSFTKERAQELALNIQSGLFEVKLELAEASIIPATMGSGAVTAGIIACIVGLIFIFIVMYILYGDLGLLSNLSLLVFVILFLGALAVIEIIQLTLPGIAGIILSLGMAVDANILIFERIKDEYRNGKRMAVAIESGFNKTVKTILDANITTIIAAVVLYFLGTGPIQGFAITLGLGVVISMVCSLWITRSFAKTYLYINPNNEKRLRLHKLTLKEDAKQSSEQSKKEKPKQRSLNFGGGK